MSVQERRERDRAHRHQLIVATARELAEAQGWEAVTTRRLAERIEYSQPVLYSHFSGKHEIVGAVALEGATELAAALTHAVADVPRGPAAVAALARAYVDFAERNPALYDALFLLDTGPLFADAASPAPLRAAFQALLDPLADVTGDDVDQRTFAEVFWAALHGLVALTRSGRLPRAAADRRLDLLVDRFAGG
ncbi:TetR/AcrR family transcriptional regulator [Streptomyces sp. NPDC127098]|uniref:TetR/AcrR family transcriptional regulator n=1 Tax=Streptomyces sp. NPDC127098 TaxID=3347137 RepID=UPI003651731C